MNEVIDAANKCGYALERGPANQQMERTMTMGAYKPSTLLDFEARKALEIEAIWGEPLRLATAAGAVLPRLEMISNTENKRPKSPTKSSHRHRQAARLRPTSFDDFVRPSSKPPHTAGQPA